MPRSGDRVSSVWQRELDACFATALIVGLKGRDETEPASPTQKGHADVVTAARDYIDAYLDAPLGAETLAREAGVSRRTLEYAFRTVNQHD